MASTKQARDQRDGKLRASRAELPASLSSVCLFAATSLEMLKDSFPAPALMYPTDANEAEEYLLTVNLPAFPRDVLPNLMAVIEYSDDGPVSQQIERIIREVQVFTARTHRLKSGMALTVSALCGHIINAATIHALADGLFGFSRGHSRGIDPKPLWEVVQGVLFLHDLDRNPFVMSTLRSQRDAGLPPTEADEPMTL